MWVHTKTLNRPRQNTLGGSERSTSREDSEGTSTVTGRRRETSVTHTPEPVVVGSRTTEVLEERCGTKGNLFTDLSGLSRGPQN